MSDFAYLQGEAVGMPYSAVEYRLKLKENFSDWTGKLVVVRDASGAEIARGVLAGFKPEQALGLTLDGGHPSVPGGLTVRYLPSLP